MSYTFKCFLIITSFFILSGATEAKYPILDKNDMNGWETKCNNNFNIIIKKTDFNDIKHINEAC